DIYLVKTDARGNELWSSAIGGPASDSAAAIRQTSDSGFIIAGSTASFGSGGADIYLVKTDARGNELWSSAFGGPASDSAAAILQTSDGGFIIAGSTESFGSGGTDVYLVRTNARGE
ncbi:MAG: hypothetical protein V3U31_02120, partial [Dehalococcoidia bacterium]